MAKKYKYEQKQRYQYKAFNNQYRDVPNWDKRFLNAEILEYPFSIVIVTSYQFGIAPNSNEDYE